MTARAAATDRLSRIEVAMHLRDVDLFTYCAAEEVVRIAGIAHQQRYVAGEVIYRSNEKADRLYSVVEGRVRLLPQEGEPSIIEAPFAFGVVEILSGKLRAADAEALEEVTVVAIEADDFFDLLSNNVEIVKALFREILDQEAVIR